MLHLKMLTIFACSFNTTTAGVPLLKTSDYDCSSRKKFLKESHISRQRRRRQDRRDGIYIDIREASLFFLLNSESNKLDACYFWGVTSWGILSAPFPSISTGCEAWQTCLHCGSDSLTLFPLKRISWREFCKYCFGRTWSWICVYVCVSLNATVMYCKWRGKWVEMRKIKWEEGEITMWEWNGTA